VEGVISSADFDGKATEDGITTLTHRYSDREPWTAYSTVGDYRHEAASFSDAPAINYPWSRKPEGPVAAWFQAHVFVEDVPSVEVYWGYAFTAAVDADGNAGGGYAYWAGPRQESVSVSMDYRKPNKLGPIGPSPF
jgi:hypothetical protein